MAGIKAGGALIPLEHPQIKALEALLPELVEGFFQQLSAIALAHPIGSQVDGNNFSPCTVVLIPAAAIACTANGLLVLIHHQRIQAPAGKPGADGRHPIIIGKPVQIILVDQSPVAFSPAGGIDMADEPGILRRSHAKVNHGHHAPFVQSVLIMRPSSSPGRHTKAI